MRKEILKLAEELKAEELQLYIFIHYGDKNQTIEDLMNLLGKSYRHVDRLLNQLDYKGYLDKKPLTNKKAKRKEDVFKKVVKEENLVEIKRPLKVYKSVLNLGGK